MDSLNSIPLERVQIRGAFDARSVFKGRPSQQLDEAWEQISNGTCSDISGQLPARKLTTVAKVS